MKNGASDHKSFLRFLGKAGACAALAFICLGACPGRTQDAAIQAFPQPAGDMIAGLYGLVSSTDGKLPDWDKVRACFLKEAVIVLRTSRMATSVFSRLSFLSAQTKANVRGKLVSAVDCASFIDFNPDSEVDMRLWSVLE